MVRLGAMTTFMEVVVIIAVQLITMVTVNNNHIMGVAIFTEITAMLLPLRLPHLAMVLPVEGIMEAIVGDMQIIVINIMQ